jgi:lysyl-tRNA synthetase class I
VVLTGESVEVLQADAVDFVVDVETLDVRSVLFHDDVDELVDGRFDNVSGFHS